MVNKNHKDENYIDYSLLEKTIYRFAWDGWRGSHVLWRIKDGLKNSATQDKKLVTTPNGFKMFYESQDWTKRTIYQGTYERPLLHFLDSISDIELVIDVGANIGVTLWQSMRNSLPQAKYMAFEPSEQCIGDLETLATHLTNKGEIFRIALGENEGSKEMFGLNNQLHSGLASLVNRPALVGESKVVYMSSLDYVLKSVSPVKTVTLLKIDTEGYEREVLMGARSLLVSKKVEILILEVSPNFGDTSYLEDLDSLVGMDYIWFHIVERGLFRRRGVLQRISLDHALNLSYQFNLVLFRKDKFKVYSKDPKAIEIDLNKMELNFA